MILLKYQLYENAHRERYVLVDERPANVWLALKLNPEPVLVYLSTFKMAHLKLVGRVTFQDVAVPC